MIVARSLADEAAEEIWPKRISVSLSLSLLVNSIPPPQFSALKTRPNPYLVVGPGGSNTPLLLFLPHPLRYQHEVQHPLGRRFGPRPLRCVVTSVLRLCES